MLALLRISFGSVVGKQPLLFWRIVLLGQSDNDNVNVCHATGIRAPRKSAVCKGDI